MKKRYTEEQIIGFLKEAEAGTPVKELRRRHGFSEASYFTWRNKFDGMGVSDAKRPKALEIGNSRLKRLLAESLLENDITREALRKNGYRSGQAGAGAVVSQRGLSERRSLAVVAMNASYFRYQPVADRKVALRAETLRLAQRYGAPTICPKLRQTG